ncbi:hypothetical protein R80B4_01618 [Fibrobacteres bacterium R8-0-B4]
MYKYVSLILLFNCVVFSNDCVVIFGRNDEVVNVQAADISMLEEEITITLRKDYYEIDVTFVFFNSGLTKSVQLGFPVQGAHYKFGENNVYDFKTTINNKIIPIRTTRWDFISGAMDSSSIDKHIKWFIRDAVFSTNIRTVSRVTYKARYSDCGDVKAAGYIYGTGRFWKGSIGKMTVIINHKDDLLIDKVEFLDWKNDEQTSSNTEASEFIWESNGKYKYTFRNVKPHDVQARISIYVQPFDIHGKYNGEFGVRPISMKGTHIDHYHFDYLWAWNEYLLYKNPTDIQHYTKNKIRLFINFFFAMHGYDFKNPLYKKYFQKIESFDDKNNTKYEVNYDFSERDFNEYERKN